MFLSPDTLAYMLDLGLPQDQLIELFRRLEADAQAVQPVRSSNAERQARFRAKKADSVTSNVTSNVTPEQKEAVSLSPTPPILSQEKDPPLYPLKGEFPPRLEKPNGFARFWEAYPHKVGKRDAEQSFSRAVQRMASGPEPPLSLILAGLERAKLSTQWRKGFIPNPATWLNQDRWTDQPHERPDSPDQTDVPDRRKSSAELDREGAALALARRRGQGFGQPGPVDDTGPPGSSLVLVGSASVAGRGH